MKRLRLSRWSRPLLHARPGAPAAAVPRQHPFSLAAARCQSSAAEAHESSSSSSFSALDASDSPRRPLPSPPPSRAASSAKLAALHARLALSPRIPLETLARALVARSADPADAFNNASLAYLGSTIVNYHVAEFLLCKWPRLPTHVLWEAFRAYADRACLHQVARRWGLDDAAAPGEEVDPGLLQWSVESATESDGRWGYVRSEGERAGLHRRGISSRIVLDDDFGDQVGISGDLSAGAANADAAIAEWHRLDAFSSAVHAVVGAVYAHCGRATSRAFVQSHVLSRQFDPSTLFEFKLPTRELAMLCAREGFEPPLARLESETGRASRTPVFVVGIYSGAEKLGEGAGSSLDMARRKASMAALKAWYLYSPGNKVRVPSDTMEEGAREWTPPHIDIGEII